MPVLGLGYRHYQDRPLAWSIFGAGFERTLSCRSTFTGVRARWLVFYMVGKHYFLSVDVLGQTAMMLGSDLKGLQGLRPIIAAYC